MYCANCGKELGNDFKVCAYCGTPVAGASQNTNTIQVQNRYCLNCGKELGNDFKVCAYCGAPVISARQTSRNGKLKPDKEYNLIAALFPLFWSLFKGMWDLSLFSFCLGVAAIISLWTNSVLDIAIFLAWIVARFAFLGGTANYYYRLKKTQNIWMYRALMNPELRRL